MIFLSLEGYRMVPSHRLQELRTAKGADLKELLGNILWDHQFDLVETEEMNSEMAMTNACGWSVYHFEPDEKSLRFLADDDCRFSFYFEAEGEQREDAWFYGDKIKGNAVLVIDPDGNCNFETVETSNPCM